MARPRTPRGESSGVKLPPLRVTREEREWLREECIRLGISPGKFQRDRVFAAMPGYNAPAQPGARDMQEAQRRAEMLPPFVPYDPTIKGSR